MASKYLLTDFVGESGSDISRYLNKVLATFKELNLESPKGEWMLFGGFIRDLIAGIPYEELVTKDVDVYFVYHEGGLPSSAAHQKAYAVIDRVIDLYDVEVIRYNKNTYEENPFTDYAIAKIKFKGIVFDIGFECGSRRFDYNFDFRCNSLYCKIKDGVIKQRLDFAFFENPSDIFVERCLEDIEQRKLVSVLSLFKDRYHNHQYVRNLKIRTSKMVAYGYQPDPNDIPTLTKIYADRIERLEESIKYDAEREKERQDSIQKVSKSLKRVCKERKEILRSLITIKPDNNERYDQLTTTLLGLEEKEKIFLDEIKRLTYGRWYASLPSTNAYRALDVAKELNT